MFFSEYKDHLNVHTRSKKNRIFCRYKNCDKHYGSSRARNYHERMHKAKVLYCNFTSDETGAEPCGMDFTSKQLLAQHMRGQHGPGWDAPCGKHFKWPAERTKHQKECDNCIDLVRSCAKKRNKEAIRIHKEAVAKKRQKKK